jgi:flavin reductase (DIM6/NTAB) family NADH-FMN oxidoreductase RutF
MSEVVSRVITNGVYVITTKTKEKINGMTAAWVSKVSFQPSLLMVSIAPTRYTHGLIKESGYFAVNVLAEGQQDLAKHFGFKSGRKHDKFKDLSYFDAPNGSPVLDQALSYLECKVTDIFTAGDHTLFIGEVLTAKILREDKKPLIFHHGDYF